MRRFLTAFAAAVLMLSLGTADAAEYKKMTIRAATANPQGSLHVVAIDKFKEIVEKESNGAITVQTFYGGSLGDEQANVKQLRNAEIHLAVLADGNLTPFAPQAGVFILPYMFPKISDAEKLFGNEAFMNKTADAIAKQSRTRPLSWLVGGYRIITNSKKPITCVDDLKGLKIRTMTNDLHVAYFQYLGALPTPMAFNELYTAMQQGTVDGQENPTAMIWNNNIYEVQKYMTVSEHIWTSTALCVAENFLESLPQDYQDAIREAGANTTALQAEMITEENQSLLQNIEDARVEVTTLSDEAKAEFQQKAKESVWVTAADLYGQDLIDLADSFNQ